MSDEEFREIERRWRSSGQLEDEVEWLQARVRAGQLSPDRLDLAAKLGHGVGSALGISPQPPFPVLEPWGDVICTAAALVARSAAGNAQPLPDYDWDSADGAQDVVRARRCFLQAESSVGPEALRTALVRSLVPLVLLENEAWLRLVSGDPEARYLSPPWPTVVLLDIVLVATTVAEVGGKLLFFTEKEVVQVERGEEPIYAYGGRERLEAYRFGTLSKTEEIERWALGLLGWA